MEVVLEVVRKATMTKHPLAVPEGSPLGQVQPLSWIWQYSSFWVYSHTEMYETFIA